MNVNMDRPAVVVDKNIDESHIKALEGLGFVVKTVDCIAALCPNEQEPAIREILESITDCYYLLDHDWRFVDINRQALRYFAKTKSELIGESVWEVFPYKIGTDVETQFKNAIAAGTDVHFETYFIDQDKWSEVHAYPSQNGLAVYFRNITSRKKAEEEIRYLARFPLENPGPVIRVTSDHVLAFANPAARELCAKIRCKEDGRFKQQIIDNVDAALAGGDAVKKEILCDDRIFSFDFHPVPEDNYVNIYGTDITERTLIEDTLKRSEERFRALLNCEAVGVVIAKEGGYIVDANAAFARMLGYEKEELQRAFYGTLTHPDDLAIERPLAEQMIRGEREYYQIEKRYIRKDGGVVWGRLTAAKLRDIDGQHIGGLCVVEDISDRKKVEADLLQSRALAERQAAEIEFFVSSVAHGVVLFDADRNVLLANDALKELLNPPDNMPLDQWIRQYEIKTLNNEEIPQEDWPSQKALRGETTTDARYKMISPWNESLVSISGGPVCDSHGNILGGTLLFQEISETLELERLQDKIYQREHYIADILQQALVPNQIPYQIGGFLIAGRYQAALDEARIGGDFYDVFRLGDNKIGVLIGDVAGKGTKAAMRVAAAKHTIRAYALLNFSPAEVLNHANRALCNDDLECEDSMLTAFFATIDLNSRLMVYSNGGHEPPVIYRSDHSIQETDAAGGMPLGIFKNALYTEASYQLQALDTLLLMTDGITEARTEESMFDKQGVFDHLLSVQGLPPDLTADSLLHSAILHAEGHLQDDAAVVVLKLQN